MHQVVGVYRPARTTNKRFRVLYGGSGSSKSTFACQDELARIWDNPRERILVIRKVAATIRNSTFRLFKDILLALGWWPYATINKSEMSINIQGGGEIIHAGLDDVEKLKSIAGITRILVEEATELSRSDLAQLDLRLRGVPNPQITLLFNPVSSARTIFDYLKIPISMLPFRSHFETDDVYVQHTTYQDNPFIGEDYVRVFQRVGGSMQTIYERGELSDDDDDIRHVIPYKPLREAHERWASRSVPDVGLSALGVDIARGGKDRTCIARRYGNWFPPLRAVPGTKTPDGLTAATVIMEHLEGDALINIDIIGVGGSAYDTVRAIHKKTQAVNFSGKSSFRDRTGKLKMRNLRAEAYWRLREALDQSLGDELAIPPDDELDAELIAPTYEVTPSGVQIEKKEAITERLGRSPDKADALVMTLLPSRGNETEDNFTPSAIPYTGESVYGDER